MYVCLFSFPRAGRSPGSILVIATLARVVPTTLVGAKPLMNSNFLTQVWLVPGQVVWVMSACDELTDFTHSRAGPSREETVPCWHFLSHAVQQEQCRLAWLAWLAAEYCAEWWGIPHTLTSTFC